MRGELRHLATLGALIACFLLTACARPQRIEGPEAVLAEFRAALRRKDPQAAYALLSRDAQARITPAAFAAALRENPQEASALEHALAKQEAPRVAAQVRLTESGRVVELVREPESGRFRIETSLVDFYPQGTPREALQSFLRAVEHARWDVVLRLMPEADRAGLDAATLEKHLAAQLEELTRIVALLKTAQDAPIEIVGERATMPYGESFTARFLHESDGWKLEDPE